jgi:hypothetical protein
MLNEYLEFIIPGYTVVGAFFGRRIGRHVYDWNQNNNLTYRYGGGKRSASDLHKRGRDNAIWSFAGTIACWPLVVPIFYGDQVVKSAEEGKYSDIANFVAEMAGKVAIAPEPKRQRKLNERKRLLAKVGELEQELGIGELDKELKRA